METADLKLAEILTSNLNELKSNIVKRFCGKIGL